GREADRLALARKGCAMSRIGQALTLGLLTASFLLPHPVRAQTPPQRGRLIVTVTDTTGGVIPNASVKVVGLDPASKATTVAPLTTSATGIATFDALVLGRYSVMAEFQGFDPGLLRDITVKRGDNKQVVILPLTSHAESVTVGVDRQESASSRV